MQWGTSVPGLSSEELFRISLLPPSLSLFAFLPWMNYSEERIASFPERHSSGVVKKEDSGVRIPEFASWLLQVDRVYYLG